METLANFKDQSTGMIKIFYINPKEELDREFTTGLRFDFALMEAWLQEGFERARDVMRDSPNGNFPFL